MNTIPYETVDAAIDFVCSIDSEQDMTKLSESFFESQPSLAQAILDYTEDLSEDAQDLILVMGIIIWKSFESAYKNLPAMTDEQVEKLYESFEAALPDEDGMTEAWFVSLIESSDKFCQPEIFKYIVSELFSEPEDEDAPVLTDVENTQLTLGLRFFSEALHALAQSGKGSNLSLLN